MTNLDLEGWRRLGGSAILGMVLLSAALPLSRVYSIDTLITLYILVGGSLLCEFAQWYGGWRDRQGRPASGRRVTALLGRSLWVLPLYLGLVGLSSAASGANTDQAVAGGLLAGGAALTGAAWLLAPRVPALHWLTVQQPAGRFGLFVILEACAQNLAPQAAAASVATTIARPVTASDLIVNSVPFGVCGLLLVGPVVRRNLGPWLDRLGLTAGTWRWVALGAPAGALLVPAGDALFNPVRDQQLHRFVLGTLATAGLFALCLIRSTEPPRSVLRVPIPGTSRVRWIILGAVALATLVLCSVVLGGLSDALPMDCAVQQQQVGQSLSGGSGGRGALGNIGIALAAGIDEELLFRGAIQPRIGVLPTAVLFGTFHLQYTCHGLPSVGDAEIVFLGVMFGLLRRRFGLPAAIAAHVFYDGSLLLGLTL